MNILPGNLRFGAGKPIKRLEDQRLLTGKGAFIDDKPEDGALWLYVLRSPHAHAKILSIDTADAAKLEEAFAKATHVVSLDLVSQRLVPSAMEPRSTIAEVEKGTGRLLLHTQSQTPASTRDLLAGAILKRPPDSVRVLVGDIGGGFGQKTSLYPEDGIVAYAATKLNKKIRWRGDRTDEFVGGTHGRDLTSTGEFALDGKGRVLAYRVRSIGGTGAYSSGTANIIPLVLGPFVQTGVYDLPLVHFEVKSVMTNTAPVGAYRGAGRPEAVFIVERLMAAAARRLGMDAAAI